MAWLWLVGWLACGASRTGVGYGYDGAATVEGPAPIAVAPDQALAELDVALHAEDVRYGEQLLEGTPDDRRRRLAPLARTTSKSVSMHQQHLPESDEAASLALRTVLRRKGQLVDAEYDTLHLVRSRADAAGLEVLEGLRAATRRQSELHGAPASPEARAAADAEVAHLQAELAARSGPYAKVAIPTTVPEVAAALPPGSVLLELVVYRPWARATDALGDERYAAYVLHSSGAVVGADLGARDALDADVRSLRAGLVEHTPLEETVEALRRHLIAPVAEALEGFDHVVVAPDGLLNMVPFDVLLPGSEVSHVTSGRDLLQLGAWKGELTAPAVLFGVSYDDPTVSPLPGTEREGRAIQRRFPEVRVLTGAEASEAAVKGLVRPRFLHVASHGFFDGGPGGEGSRGIEAVTAPAVAGPEAFEGAFEHPALRSGVLLAGGGGDDGRLTAAEWSNLDLRSTRVVVLSACDTAVGEVRNGDGVHGLRRALVLAGSQAQVLSLWKVDDDATAELMEALYRELEGGRPLGPAMAAAKQHVASQAKWRHPFFWAAFTVAGRWDVRLSE